jgi:hypothetical protein
MILRAVAWFGIGSLTTSVECQPIGPMATSSIHVAVTISESRRAIAVQAACLWRLSA